MKTLIITGITLITMALTTNPVTAQDQQHHENHEQMIEMMEDPDMRAMMMEMMQDSPMIGVHMGCMQMMQGDDMEGVDSESGDHEHHH